MKVNFRIRYGWWLWLCLGVVMVRSGIYSGEECTGGSDEGQLMAVWPEKQLVVVATQLAVYILVMIGHDDGWILVSEG